MRNLVSPESPVVGYCSGCRAERRLRFAGYASDGRENSVRPRAFYRACQVCSASMLVLADADDALGLVRNAIRDWQRASGVERHGGGDPSRRTIDFDDLAGELLINLWSLYSTWDPVRLSFTSYAAGLLPRRIASYVRDAVGGEAVYRRNGRGGLCRVWPKAHATSVCDSLDGAASSRENDDGDDGWDRLAVTHGTVSADHTRDRSPDLAWLLARGSG